MFLLFSEFLIIGIRTIMFKNHRYSGVILTAFQNCGLKRNIIITANIYDE